MGSTLPPPAHVPIQPGVGEKQHRQEGTPPFLPGWGELGTREGGGHLGSARRGHVPSPGDKHRCPERCCPWGGDGGDGRDNEGGGTRRDTWTGDLGGDTHGHLERLWPPGGGSRGTWGTHAGAWGDAGTGGTGANAWGCPGCPERCWSPVGGRDGTGRDTGDTAGGGGGGTHAVACRDSGPGKGTWGTHAGAWRNVSPGEGTWGRHGGPRGNMGHPERGGGAGETLAPGREHGISSTHA